MRRFAAIPAHPQKQYTRRWRLYHFCGFYYPIREVMRFPFEESVESKLMWEGIKKYLHKLTPKECEVMISLYVEHLSVRETAAKLKVEDSTVSTHHKNACDKIRNAMEEQYYGEF